MRLFYILVIALFIALPVQAAEQSTLDRVLASATIRCGYFTWPPYIAKDPNTGKLSGK